MDIQVRTDYHVKGDAGLNAYIEDEVAAGLEPYLVRLTSVHVHLSEESGARKGPPDLRCMIQVRPAHHEPVVVTRHASTKEEVIRSAIDGMRIALDRLFGRLSGGRRTGADTIRGRGGEPAEE
jgi:hypothetical protein